MARLGQLEIARQKEVEIARERLAREREIARQKEVEIARIARERLARECQQLAETALECREAALLRARVHFGVVDVDRTAAAIIANRLAARPPVPEPVDWKQRCGDVDNTGKAQAELELAFTERRAAEKRLREVLARYGF